MRGEAFCWPESFCAIFVSLCGSLPPTTVPISASAETSEARGWHHGLREVGDSFYSITLKLMENKPNSDGDYVVIVVRLPVRLLMQLGRWLLVAASTYVLLRQ